MEEKRGRRKVGTRVSGGFAKIVAIAGRGIDTF